MNQPEFRFRFGLRAMIVGLTVLGVGTGLLGQLYFSNFQAFVGITSAIFTVLPFLLAVGTLVRLGVKSKQPTLILWGVLLFVTPIVGLSLLAVLQSMSGPYGDGMGLLSNKRLIQERIAKDADTPGLWRELERRLHAGSLTNQEVDEAVGQLVSYMKKKRPNGWNQPLNWQDDFLRAAREADAISVASLTSLCEAFFGSEPKVDPIDASDGSESLDVRVNYGSPWDNDMHSGIRVHHMWNVTRILVDGQEVNVEAAHRFAQRWTARTGSELPPHPKELTVEVEAAYIDSSKMIGLNDDNLDPALWPKAIKRWKKLVTMPLDGSNAEKPRELQLVTDPARRPAGEITIKRLVAQKDRDGLQQIILQLEFGRGLTIPLSFDVLLEFDDQKHDIGASWACRTGNNGQMSSGNMVTAGGQMIDPLVRAANVVLQPNVEHIRNGLRNNRQHEGIEDIHEVWGKPIVFPDVPFERLDLEIGQIGTEAE